MALAARTCRQRAACLRGTMLAYLDDELTEPEPEAEPDIGPIVAATVEPGLTIVFGERGTDRHLNGAIRDRLPENVPTISLVEPVNAGASYDREVGIGEPMIEPPSDVEKQEERLTFGAVKALMRPAMRPMGTGGSGSGRVKKKPKPPPLGLQPDIREPKRVERFQVTGLTVGEREFYARRTGEAKMVLRATVGKIVAGALENERPPIGPRLPHSFSVYGLDDHEARILKVYPGSARAALAAHAREVDGTLVKLYDAGAGLTD